MNEIKIETGIPIPTRRELVPGGIRKLIDKLNIGESVVVSKLCRGSISNIGSLMQKKFVTRKVDEENIRVWRVG